MIDILLIKKSSYLKNWVKFDKANHSSLLSVGWKKIFEKALPGGSFWIITAWVISLCVEGNDRTLGESLDCKAWVKCLDLIFWLASAFSGNLNNINLKGFHDHGGIHKFERKFIKNIGEW